MIINVDAAHIRCDEVSPLKYFKQGACDGAFLTKEYTYDAGLLKEKLLSQIRKYSNIQLVYNARIASADKDGTEYAVAMEQIFETASHLSTKSWRMSHISGQILLGYSPHSPCRNVQNNLRILSLWNNFSDNGNPYAHVPG